MGDEKSFFHEGKIARHLREEDELGRVRLFEKKKKKKEEIQHFNFNITRVLW